MKVLSLLIQTSLYGIAVFAYIDRDCRYYTDSSFRILSGHDDKKSQKPYMASYNCLLRARLGNKLYITISDRLFSDFSVSDKRLLVCSPRLPRRTCGNLRRRRCNSAYSYLRVCPCVSVRTRCHDTGINTGLRLPRRCLLQRGYPLGSCPVVSPDKEQSSPGENTVHDTLYLCALQLRGRICHVEKISRAFHRADNDRICPCTYGNLKKK